MAKAQIDEHNGRAHQFGIAHTRVLLGSQLACAIPAKNPSDWPAKASVEQHKGVLRDGGQHGQMGCGEWSELGEFRLQQHCVHLQRTRLGAVLDAFGGLFDGDKVAAVLADCLEELAGGAVLGQRAQAAGQMGERASVGSAED